MDTYNHFEYAEFIARHLRSVAHTNTNCHFLRSDEVEDITDLSERISRIKGFVLIAIDGFNSDFGWADSDNLMNIPQYYLAIVRQTEAGNIDAIHDSKNLCRTELMQVIGKMMAHYEMGYKGMEFLDIASMSIRGVGPLAERFYGVMLGFNMNNPTAFGIDESKWI